MQSTNVYKTVVVLYLLRDVSSHHTKSCKNGKRSTRAAGGEKREIRGMDRLVLCKSLWKIRGLKRAPCYYMLANEWVRDAK